MFYSCNQKIVIPAIVLFSRSKRVFLVVIKTLFPPSQMCYSCNLKFVIPTIFNMLFLQSSMCFPAFLIALFLLHGCFYNPKYVSSAIITALFPHSRVCHVWNYKNIIPSILNVLFLQSEKCYSCICVILK